VAAPVPPAAVPVEVADKQAAIIALAVDRPPEEGVADFARRILLPVLGNEVGIGQQEVQLVGVHHGLVGKFLAELVAHDGLAVLLTIREVELHLGRVEDELAALLVFLDGTVVGHERAGIAVDDVRKLGHGDRYLRIAGQTIAKLLLQQSVPVGAFSIIGEAVRDICDERQVRARNANKSPDSRAEHVFGHGLFPFQALGSEPFGLP